jgi:hypothetical protein
MFTFPIMAVRKVIARGEADAAANGGFRNPYYGRLGDGETPLVVYSAECHPKGNPDWWDYKRRYFGGDDGIEFIDADLLIPSFNRNFGATHLGVQLTEHDISLSLITR